MAVHAGSGGRDVGKTRGPDRSVAVAAVDADAPHVMLMAERHRLLPGHRRPSAVVRLVQFIARPAQKPYKKDRAVNRNARQCVRTVMKDLRHSSTGAPFRRLL